MKSQPEIQNSKGTFTTLFKNWNEKNILLTAAVINVEIPSTRVLDASALFFARSFITSTRPSLAANHIADTSEEATALTSAPLSRRNSTIFSWPMILKDVKVIGSVGV